MGRPEGEGRKGHHGGNRGGCGGSIEEEWLLQDRRRVELEAQEKASNASQEGCEPIHKRTVRFQSQASFEDRQGIAYEEAEGDDQLEAVRVGEDENQYLFEDLESLNFGRGGRTHQVCHEGIVLQRRPTEASLRW